MSMMVLGCDSDLEHLPHVSHHRHGQLPHVGLQHLVHVPGPMDGRSIDVGHNISGFEASQV